AADGSRSRRTSTRIGSMCGSGAGDGVNNGVSTSTKPRDTSSDRIAHRASWRRRSRAEAAVLEGPSIARASCHNARVMKHASSFAIALAVVVAAVVVAIAGPARAATYYVGEIGARSTARGGANLVAPSDPTAAWLNPA